MKILRLEVQGFRSFTSPQTLDLTKLTPGLYHVSGKNLVEPELEANGAGKSSLFESIYWTLYGKTSRNLKAKSVKNWNSDERCGAVLDLQTTSGPVSLLRTWGPNALEVSGKSVGDRPIDQIELEKLIGLSPEAFLFSIYFAQFAPAFVDLSPADQTAVFSTVLGLDLWERASKLANERTTDAEAHVQRARESVARLQGQAEELLAQDYSKAQGEWEKSFKTELKAATDTLALKKQVMEALLAEAKVYDKITEAADKQLRVVGDLANDRDRLFRDVNKLSAQNITKCPTCGQPVNRQHIKKELAKITALLDQKEIELDAAKKKHSGLCKQIPADYESKQSAADREFQFAHADFLNVKSKTNPYTKLRAEQEQRGEQLAQQLDKVEAELVTSEKQVKVTQYWVKGFKEIRLSQIQESLSQLTIEVNETLYQLGLQEWSVEFDIERENKSGTINRSFTILIRSPHTEDAVPWEVWSGGESQRLRLAISLGFANLITSRMGIQPNVEMYDEPSQFLSESGIQDLLTVLAERAERQKKIILLADHRVLDFGGFAGTLMVTKDENGSHIETV